MRNDSNTRRDTQSTEAVLDDAILGAPAVGLANAMIKITGNAVNSMLNVIRASFKQMNFQSEWRALRKEISQANGHESEPYEGLRDIFGLL